MENLEKTVIEEGRPLIEVKPLYEGFKKIEDKAYSGPTSIKYWM